MRAVVYARFSTDKQGDSSTAAQLRSCRDYAEHNGLSVIGEYTDEGVSSGIPFEYRAGASSMRPLLTRGSVLLVMHTDRLARSEDLAPLITRLRRDGVRVIGVQDAFDSDKRQIARIQATVTGLVGSEFRAATSDKTREALRLAFEQGFHVGGSTYGYAIITTDVQYKDGHYRKRLEIEQAQAAIVLRIYGLYADENLSPRNIAARLNGEGVPSPGAHWRRKVRRSDAKWLASAVLSILCNDTYSGVIRYGTRYSHTLERRDRGARLWTAASEPALERREERLRIIPDDLWQRARARQARIRDGIGQLIRAGHRKNAPGAGRPPKHVFSGLLQCSECGASFVLRNRTCYACASWWDGAACSNSINVPRALVQDVMLCGLREDFSDPAMLDELDRRFTAAIRQDQPHGFNPDKRIAELEKQVERLVDAIASGTMSASAALAERLQRAEGELTSVKNQAVLWRLPAIPSLSAVRRRFGEIVAGLDHLLRDPERGREELRGILGGKVKLRPDQSRKFLWADYSLGLRALLPNAEIMVAGAGFEPATFGL